MAIYSAVPPPPELSVDSTATSQPQTYPEQPQAAGGSSTNSGHIDIEAWTISALQSLSVSATARGTGASLSIPLDEQNNRRDAARPSVAIQETGMAADAITPPRRPPSRRDSMKRRDALMKGKEGSRQRRRWENGYETNLDNLDRLMHVPNVQPPQPSDYEPRPTHPVQYVPYQITAAWDTRMRAEVEAKTAAAARRKQMQTRTLGDANVAGRVPRELFVRAKKTPAVRIWVRSLEEPVRRFLIERRGATTAGGEARAMAQQRMLEDDSDSGEGDTEDEEIVFVGRNGSMRDGWKKAKREGRDDEKGMVFDAVGDDESSAFKRWLTHSISDYYGLDSHSVMMGNPSRKVVYVGIKEIKAGHAPTARAHLPRPLWELC
ncbi:hypothetical protein BX600DRAFT_520159 [Xylariales sp. PMI_506]|nr:hypothetical protein BX600DRAFT_520159 [Xylariales sp. PMI_506]